MGFTDNKKNIQFHQTFTVFVLLFIIYFIPLFLSIFGGAQYVAQDSVVCWGFIHTLKSQVNGVYLFCAWLWLFIIMVNQVDASEQDPCCCVALLRYIFRRQFYFAWCESQAFFTASIWVLVSL